MCKIATAFMECGLYAKAEQYYKTAAESAQNLLQAKCQFGVAVVQRELYKNSDRANELFAQATKMVDEVGDEDMQQKATPYADIARNQGISCLVKQDFPAVRAHFQRGIVCARDTSSLQNFLIPLLNYFALATARQAETVKSAGGDAQALFQEATPYFADARKKYLDYAEANAQVLDQGCQDWASHVYHDALAAFMMGDLSRAYIGYTKTYEIRVSCNLQGQQRNRLADVLADLGRVHQAQEEFDMAREKFLAARGVYQSMENPGPNKIEQLDKLIAELDEKLSSAVSALSALKL